MNLALELRPKLLDDVIGNDKLKTAIKKFINDECNHWLFYGPTGTGKTTLAKIVANEMAEEIYPLNASEMGVSGLREYVDQIKCYPMTGKQGRRPHRVSILDEAHRLTKDAQTVLLSTFEENDEGVNVWILCTTEKDGILKALRDRCPANFKLQEMGPAERHKLVHRAAEHLNYAGDLTKFLKKLDELKFVSARDVLASFERVYKGVPIEEAVEV